MTIHGRLIASLSRDRPFHEYLTIEQWPSQVSRNCYPPERSESIANFVFIFKE